MSTTYTKNSEIPMTADAAIAQYARVLVEADGRIVTAGLADVDIGVAMVQAFAAGDVIRVRLRNAQGSVPMIASEAIEVGDLVYSEMAGKCQDTAQATSFLVGQAVTPAGADGEYLEVIRFDGGVANV